MFCDRDNQKGSPWVNLLSTELVGYQLPEDAVNQLAPLSLWNRDLRKNVTRAEFASIAFQKPGG